METVGGEHKQYDFFFFWTFLEYKKPGDVLFFDQRIRICRDSLKAKYSTVPVSHSVTLPFLSTD